MEKSFLSAATTNPSSSAATSSTFTAAASFSTNPMLTSSSTITNTNTNSSLRTLNRSSYKISKPLSQSPNLNPIRPAHPINDAGDSAAGGALKQHQPQPPVYNINKNDFRDVVQKLTGSPAHLSNHPPASRPLSRLHLIRPPPLAQFSSFPPLPVPSAAPAVSEGWVPPPFSPLPPFPAVCATAESPISAYMRRLHSEQLVTATSPSPPLVAFGCALAPTLFFPSSPGLPIPSPKWGEP